MNRQIFFLLFLLFGFTSLAGQQTYTITPAAAPEEWPADLPWWKRNNLRVMQTNLPAYEAESRFSSIDDRFEYWTRRPDGTTARLNLTVGPGITPTDIDRFLTARWRIVLPPRWWDPPEESRAIATVHEPWILHRASVELFDDEVLVAAGLPPATGPGQALWSPGTAVDVGLRRGDG